MPDPQHDQRRRGRPTFLPPEAPRPAGRELPPLPDRQGIGAGAITLITLGAIAVMIALVLVIFDIGHGRNDTPLAIPSGPIASLNLPPEPGPTGPPVGPLKTFPGTPTPANGRIVDPIAGLSYARFGAPWRPLGVTTLEQYYTAGQAFVTETSKVGTDWYASIGSLPLSAELLGSTPGNPGNLRTTAFQQSGLLASSSYPAGSKRTEIADQSLTVSGKPAWLIGFHESFSAPGFKVTGETGVVVVVSGGSPEPGVLFVSIPDTRKDLLPDINAVVKSLQVS